MRWFLYTSLTLVAICEGILLTNFPLFGVEIPATWLAVFICLSNEWVGWRQSLVMTVTAGYLLDAIAAPAAGTVLLSMIAAWAIAYFILNKYNYSRDSKLLALSVGSLAYLFGSLITGQVFPGVLTLLVWSAIYLIIIIVSYMVVSTVVKLWLRRV